MRKYRNKPTTYKGIKFDSILECDRYKQLELLERAGEIRDLQTQPKFILQDKFERGDRKIRAITYKGDFYYYDCKIQRIVCEEIKGFETRDYKLRKKMFLKRFPNIVFFQNSKKKKEYYK